MSTRIKRTSNTLPMSSHSLTLATSIPKRTDKKKKKRAFARKEEKAIKIYAYNEVMAIGQSNGGNTKYGDIQDIIKMYNKLGYSCITAGLLNCMVFAWKMQTMVHPPAVIQETYTCPSESQSSLLTFSASSKETNNSSLFSAPIVVSVYLPWYIILQHQVRILLVI